jgi:hypothetical protein|nr:MAG TPA: hypothetical protein [Bacteriophage sp.]
MAIIGQVHRIADKLRLEAMKKEARRTRHYIQKIEFFNPKTKKKEIREIEHFKPKKKEKETAA